MTEGLKILKAASKNFKGLDPIDLDIAGQSMMVIGPNASGKSSFIQAIMSSLDGNYKPLEAITKGEEKASIELSLGGTVAGEKRTYTVEMYFSQEKKTGRLVLTDTDGSKIPSPKKALESIIGNISFNIDQFVALSKTDSGAVSEAGIKKQIEILKDLLPVEIKKELFDCDKGRKADFDERTTVNAEIKILEGKADHDMSDEDLKKYAVRADEEAINKKIADIGKAVEDWDKISKGVGAREDIINSAETLGKVDPYKNNFDAVQLCLDSLQMPNAQETVTLTSHLAKHKSLMSDAIATIESAPKAKEELKKAQGWLKKNPEKPTTQSLLDELKLAQEHNKKCDEVAALGESHKQIEAKKKESEALTKKIESWVGKKKKMFAKNPLPVKYLSFDENQVLYRDLPFDDVQHPTSTIMGVGIKIAMAMNPTLKVIVIRDGSLLDKEMANGILKMVHKEGYQLFIEMVSWTGKEMEIKYIESEIE